MLRAPSAVFMCPFPATRAELETKEREIAQLERELEGARKALEEMSPDAAAHQRRLQEAQDAVEAVSASWVILGAFWVVLPEQRVG